MSKIAFLERSRQNVENVEMIFSITGSTIIIVILNWMYKITIKIMNCRYY